MPVTNQTIRARQRAARARRAARNRLIIGSIVFVFLAFFAWLILSAQADRRASLNQTATALGPTAHARQWSSPPEMTIDVNKRYTATIVLAKGGEIVLELYPAQAPMTVNNFVFLARQGFYDGTTFHRVIPGFVAQGGDPTGTGAGTPGYFIPNEDNELTFAEPGMLAMANSGRDRNGCQFFITYTPQERLNGSYTIFGKVIEGMDVLMGLTPRDPDASPTQAGDVIETILITEE